jgi:hypothetical protein
MKRIIFSAMLLFIFTTSVPAQVGRKEPAKQTTIAKTNIVKKGKVVQKPMAVTTLNSTSNNAAFGNAAEQRFRISDPTIIWFNNRTYNTKFENGSSLIGIPKLSSGIAHGHLIFYPTAATTSGSSTGSGAVGTGSSIGNVGTNGSGLGVNGKNPYAGPGMYGTRTQADLWLRRKLKGE